MPLNEGPVKLIPTLKVSLSYDDNIDQSSASEAKRGSFVTKIAPSFMFRSQDRRNVYELRYDPAYSYYASESGDSHLDHRLMVRSKLEFDRRNMLDLRANYSRTQATKDEINRAAGEDGNILERYGVDGNYRFGSTTSKAQIELKAGYLWNRYKNNLTADSSTGSPGSNNRSKEYLSPSVAGTFYWRVAPKTRLLAEVAYAQFDYQWASNERSSLDSKNLTYLAGVTWRATGKTSGTLKVGLTEKDFRSAVKDGSRATAWDANIIWRPIDRASINLSTKSRIAEGSSTEDDIKQQDFRLTWKHQWDSKFSSNAGLLFREKKYQGGANNDRKDELTEFSVGMTYSARRWLDLGIEGRIKDNKSTLSDAAYDRNTIFFTTNMSL